MPSSGSQTSRASAEPTELDTAYELESVDASGAKLELDRHLARNSRREATLKADADAETTLLLTLSAGASTTFATAWQFALPLALLESGGPQAAATLMAATTGAKVLAPSVGRLADKAPRVDAARAARALRACGVGLSCLALPHLADETSWLPLLLAGSAIEALGAVVTKGAPRKDWAPTLLEGDALRKATVSLSNAALLGELAGPALGAFVLGASGAPTVGAAAVAGELAAQAALERLRARAPSALSAPKGETTKAAPAWAAFFGQPSGAAITTVAFALLWFTALTPHAPVLLAALADRGAPAESLAAFRAAGASRRRRRGPLRGGRRRPHRNAAGANDHDQRLDAWRRETWRRLASLARSSRSQSQLPSSTRRRRSWSPSS